MQISAKTLLNISLTYGIWGYCKGVYNSLLGSDFLQFGWHHFVGTRWLHLQGMRQIGKVPMKHNYPPKCRLSQPKKLSSLYLLQYHQDIFLWFYNQNQTALISTSKVQHQMSLFLNTHLQYSESTFAQYIWIPFLSRLEYILWGWCPNCSTHPAHTTHVLYLSTHRTLPSLSETTHSFQTVIRH